MFYRMSRRDMLALSLLMGFLCAVVFGCRFSQFAKTAQQVREQTLRLHIKANSDSLYDQQLKLKVRDAVMQNAGLLFAQSNTKEEALAGAQKTLKELEQIAENTLKQHGCALPVQARVITMYFDTTAYTGFTLPAGEYDALRLEIGTGNGHNWFCVLYPGLCLPAAEGERIYPDVKSQSLIEAKPEIRFAALEWTQKIRKYLQGKD